MKKGTEGYVLIYVLVVFILLGLACATVCTFALNGLKTQRAALENDRQRYAAEGVAEQAAARLLDSTAGVVALTGSGFSDEMEAQTKLEEAYKEKVEGLEDDIEGLSVNDTESSWDSDAKTCVFETEIQAERAGQQVQATLQVTLAVKISSYLVDSGEVDEENQPIMKSEYEYEVTSAQLSYADYQIQAAEPEGGEGP